ncbi:MAG: MFS transporter, partial [Acidimicrobiia bacterium]|nr:MFS transporter [Acidimicrobiia bacterium]
MTQTDRDTGTTSEPVVAGAEAEPRTWGQDIAIAAAGFAVEGVLFGVLYTFGVVLDPIREDLGARRSTVALMPAISAFLLFFVGPFTGWLADRFGTHRTLAAGAATLSAGLALASIAPSLWLVVLAYGVLGGVAASLAYVPVVAHIAALPSRRAPALVGIV